MLEQSINAFQLGVMLFLTSAGLTLIFGILNFINLAHGSMYMVGAFVGATALAQTGSFSLGMVAGLAGGAITALILETAIFRRLYTRDHNAQVLATFGLILFFNEAVRIAWGNAPLFISIPPLLSGAIELIPGLPYPAYRLAITVAGLVIALGLALLIQHTRLGAHIRAGASNREMLAAMGTNVGRLCAFVALLGGALAGLAGTLMGPIQSVQVGMGEPVLILAFVVIVIGGIGSIKGAFVGSLLVGLVDTFGRFLLPKLLGYTVGPAAASLAIYVLMAAMLLFRPMGLFPAPGGSAPAPTPSDQIATPAQGALLTRRHLRILGIIAIVILALVPLANEPFYLRVLTRALAIGIAAIGLDLVFGYAGMISFGHAAFVGVGAYAIGILAAHGISEGLFVLPAAIVMAALAALVIGALSVRTSGVFFIMITLAFAQMLYYLAIGLEPYGADNGMPLKNPTRIAGVLDLSRPAVLFYVTLAATVIVVLLGRRFVGSEFGLALRGIRDNERRMATLGYATYRYKLAAFALSGAVCGLGGALLTNVDAYVGPTTFHWFLSGLLMVIVILGGQGSLVGPLLGALGYVLLEEALSSLTVHWMVLFGPVLVLVVLFTRHGLLGLLTRPGRADAK